MKLYGFVHSRALRALWALEEAGADYTFVRLDPRLGEHKAPPYLAINPAGKVPALVDGDLLLLESAAIATYVGDTHPQSGLTPPVADLKARAVYNQWCCFAISELEQPLWTIAKHKFAYPKEFRVRAVIPGCKQEMTKQLALLEAGLGDEDFILGDSMSMADVLLGHTLSWAKDFKVDLDATPAVSAYHDRLMARPARVRAQNK
jgi:glutathione S-transferase